MRLKLKRSVIGYGVTALAMLVIFLTLRFPGQALTDYVKAALTARYPDLRFSLDTIRPSFPPGIALSAITVGLRDRPDALFRADALAVRPEGYSLLGGRYAILMTAEAYGGEMRGRVDFSQRLSLQGPFSAQWDVQDLRIEKCTWLREIFARQIAGKLKGAVSFSATTGAPQTATGNIDFVLTNGTLPLQENFFGFDKIEFTRVEGKASFRNGALKITQLTLNGDQFRTSLKGNILLADELKDSQIDLSGTVEIPMQNNRRVTLGIGGTLSNPKIRLL